MQYNDSAEFVTRLFMPLNSIKYKTNPVPTGSLLHIQNHLLPGRESKEKGEGIFKLLIKVKMHLGSFKCNTFRCERRASFMCVRRHCEGKVLWNCGSCQAWNRHQHSYTGMLDLFVHVCLSTHQPGKVPTCSQSSCRPTLPAWSGQQVWVSVSLQLPSANMGLPGASPRHHPSWDLHISSSLS